MTSQDVADIFDGRFDSECDLSDFWCELMETENEACTAYFDRVAGETSPFDPDEKEEAVADPILKGVMLDDYSGTKRAHGREWCIKVFGADEVARIEALQYNTVNGE